MATDIVEIGLRIDSLDAELAKQRLLLLGKQGKKTEGALSKLAKSIKGALIGAIAGLTAVIAKGIATYIQFNKSLQELSAITGAAGNDLLYYKKQSIDMARATGFAASEVVKAFKLIASAKPDLLENKEALASVTKEVLTLARAASIDLETAANALGSTLNQFSADASEAGRFINVLAAGSKLGASEVGDMAEAMKVAGTVASGMHISFEETNAALQLMAAMAIKGSEAGTGLRGVLLKLSTQTKDDFNPAIVGLTQAMKNLEAAHLSDTKKADLFGQESISAANALMKQAGAIGELTKKLTGTNIAYEQAAINSDTLEIRIKKMQARWEEMTLVMIEKVLPAINKIIDGLVELAPVVGGIADMFVKAGTSIGEFFAKVSLGLNGMPAYYIKPRNAAETLTEQMERQASVVRDLTSKLFTSASQYEELTKHIDSLSGVTGVSTATMETLRAKQAELKAESEKYAKSLKTEKDALDALNASMAASAGTGGTPSASRPDDNAARAAALAKKRADEEALLDWELDRAIEQQEEMERIWADGVANQELNRAIHDEEELERIYKKNQAKLEAERAYHDELYNIDRTLALESAALKKAIHKEEYADAVAHGLRMLMNVTQHSKKAHGIYKAAAIAKTVMDTYAGAQAAYNAMAGIPIVGPALGAAAAAAAIASGMERVQAIRSTEFGGTGGGAGAGSGGSVGGGASSAPSAPVVPQQEARQEPRAVQIQFIGDNYGTDIQQTILDTITAAVNDQDVVLIGPNSRQAAELGVAR